MMKFLANRFAQGSDVSVRVIFDRFGTRALPMTSSFPKPLPGQLIQQGRVATVRPSPSEIFFSANTALT